MQPLSQIPPPQKILVWLSEKENQLRYGAGGPLGGRHDRDRLIQRCHMIHDRPHHLAHRRITYLLRRALGDLFLGPYSVWFVAQNVGQIATDKEPLRLLSYPD
jgi:hypothetical protein